MKFFRVAGGYVLFESSEKGEIRGLLLRTLVTFFLRAFAFSQIGEHQSRPISSDSSGVIGICFEYSLWKRSLESLNLTAYEPGY